MSEEKNAIIKYEGNQIAMFYDERNDYVCLTDLAKAWKGRKSIWTWLKNKATLEFLQVWEKKHNPNFLVTEFGDVLKQVKDKNFTLSLKYLIEKTKIIGIFTKAGNFAGTYAHKDIAIRFAGWLSPEFELYISEEIQRLKELERQKYSFELLTHEQILNLVRLKEVFKYVAHQTIVEDAHKEVFASKSAATNPFAEFNKWRNEILDINLTVINERIKQYCVENRIALTRKILSKTKRDKILMLDSYESVKIAVWDFLQMKGEFNALNLANLVEEMIRIEKGEVLRVNEDDLFQSKQILGEYSDFQKLIDEMPEIKTARQLLELKVQRKRYTKFDRLLKGVMNVTPEIKQAMDDGENIV